MTIIDTQRCPILILAAGRSRRMGGRDKLLEPVHDMPLIRLQSLRALETGQPVFVAVPSRDHPRARAIADLPLTFCPVARAAEGIGATLRDSMAQLPDAAAFMIMLADLIDIDTSDYVKMLQAMRGHPDAVIWRGAAQDGTAGHPIIFDASLRPAFQKLSGDTGAADIIRTHRDKTHRVLLGDQATLDLDTPADWAAWRAKSRA